ncbi:MAG: hypothetical protein GY903_31895 [Fuerstiella sp.]|nr:hypothetical protein [Fuerstiella sp.]MCP4859095.1 hypothetical protein [Fuerstiella sp.]
MTEMKMTSVSPPLPRVLGFSIGFLTVGIGVLRSIEPAEIMTRALAAGAVTWVIARCFSLLWMRMCDGILEDD